MNHRLMICLELAAIYHSPFGRVGLSGPERALPGRYRVRPSRKREGEGIALASWKMIPLVFALLLLATPAFADDGHNHLPKKQHKDSEAPFLKPAEAVAKMSIPDGFEVSVFASEPDIAEPIAFCFDDRGRMWVAENFNYQTRKQHTDEQVSRIQILEDTNGDGVFDKKKTFTDKLTFTSGLACGFGGVFVGSPPNLTFIPDQGWPADLPFYLTRRCQSAKETWPGHSRA